MFCVTPEIYGQVAVIIADRLGQTDYLSENFEFEVDGVLCRLLFSAVVYRKRLYVPEGELDVLSDLVPVWWEFHTFAAEGEMLNDFSFNELRQYFN